METHQSNVTQFKWKSVQRRTLMNILGKRKKKLSPIEIEIDRGHWFVRFDLSRLIVFEFRLGINLVKVRSLKYRFSFFLSLENEFPEKTNNLLPFQDKSVSRVTKWRCLKKVIRFSFLFNKTNKKIGFLSKFLVELFNQFLLDQQIQRQSSLNSQNQSNPQSMVN